MRYLNLVQALKAYCSGFKAGFTGGRPNAKVCPSIHAHTGQQCVQPAGHSGYCSGKYQPNAAGGTTRAHWHSVDGVFKSHHWYEYTRRTKEISLKFRKLLASAILARVKAQAIAQGQIPDGADLDLPSASVHWPFNGSANKSAMLGGMVYQYSIETGETVNQTTLFFKPARTLWVPVVGLLARAMVSRIGVGIFKTGKNSAITYGLPSAGRSLKFPVVWNVGFGVCVCVTVTRPNTGKWDTPWGEQRPGLPGRGGFA